ncbi:MAG: hypothetical protein ACOY5Y_07000 [Pseudomonadota bacterium]
MPIANPVKGEVAVKTAAATFTLCFSWPAQKAIGRRFDKPFRQALETFEGLSDDDFSFIFLTALQHHHPDLDEAGADAIISEIGFNEALSKLGESLRLAYDLGPAPEAEAAVRPPAARSEPATGTSTRASSSGSPSA